MVTRQLKKEEHKTPPEIGREAFTEKVWEWKKKYGGDDHGTDSPRRSFG